MTEKEALKLALEALKYPLNQSHENFNVDMAELLAHRAITALREALAEQPAQQALDKMAENARELGLDYGPAQQEPVAYLCENAVGHQYFRWKKPSSEYKPIALYTSPPAQRTWVGLTKQEFNECVDGLEDLEDCWTAIEAKLKEKNT